MKSRLCSYVDGQIRDLNCLLDKRFDADDVRLFCTTKQRLDALRRFYHPVSKVYSLRFGQDAVDYAFEAFVLGMVEVLDLVPLMREYYNEMNSDDNLPF